MSIKDALKKIKIFGIKDAGEPEFDPGIYVERRRLLWLPVAAIGALALPNTPFAQTTTEMVKQSLTWDDFLKETLPKAVELHKNKTAEGQDSYLYWIASMAARLDRESIPKAKLGKFKNLEPAVEFGVGYRGVPFFVVEWRMAPNAYFPPHNHPNASVCTLGLAGSARIRNFEVEGSAPEFSSTQKFVVRETHNEVISAGRFNALSAKRDNIHTFQVGKDGARGIDISTYHGENVGFSFLDIQKEPLDDATRTFEANWKKL